MAPRPLRRTADAGRASGSSLPLCMKSDSLDLLAALATKGKPGRGRFGPELVASTDGMATDPVQPTALS